MTQKRDRHVERFLTDYRDKRAVHEHLEKVMEPDGVNPEKNNQPCWKYKEPWNDKLVAEKFGFLENQISRFRQGVEMEFNPETYRRSDHLVSPWKASQTAKMGELEAEHAKLRSEVLTMQGTYDNALKTLRSEVHALRDELGRLTRVLNAQAGQINALEDAATKPKGGFHKLGDLQSSLAKTLK